MRRFSALAGCVTAFAVFGGADVSAAPVFLQSYEGAALAEPFNREPDFSAQSDGVFNDGSPNDPGSSTIVLNTTAGAIGTAQSARLNIVEDTTAGDEIANGWQVRLVPNNGANTSAGINPLFNADGYVGFYLRVDPSVAADLQVSPVLEGATGTTQATSGVLRPVIKDGQWHRYQWNMDDPADFPGTFSTVYGGAALGNTVLEAQNSFDSIAILASNEADAVIDIDQIGYDNAGQLPAVPEPSCAALLALGATHLLRRRRRA